MAVPACLCQATMEFCKSPEFTSTPIVVLSPHADDAVMSCGSLLLQHSDVLVVTVFSGDMVTPRTRALKRLPPPFQRRAEDASAMALLQCEHKNLGLPDAIDRVAEGRHLYRKYEDLFGAVNPDDTKRCGQIESQISQFLAGRTLLCPMAVGAHVDHQLCAHAGRRLQMLGHDVWFYPEAPYCFPDPGPAVTSDTALMAARRLQARIWSHRAFPVDARAKADVVACYASQVAELFGNLLTYEYLAEGHYNDIGREVELYHQLRW